MADITFARGAAPASVDHLTAIEQAYDFTLPEEYKAHLLQHNGGFPDRDSFYVEAKKYTVNKFRPVGGGKGSLEVGLESLRDELHPDLVPFANEAGGDQFVLSVGPEDYGSVYYIAHESYVPPEYDYDEETDTSTPPPPRQYGEGVYFLAPSFTAFLDGLVKGSPVA